MGKSSIGVIAILLLCVAGPACSRRENSTALAALDSAYQAGVLTKAEYDAKKSAILARLSSQAATLAALDKAREAGVLTQDEYTAKKAALLAQAVPPSAAPSASGVEPAVAATPSASADFHASVPQTASAPTASADPQGHSYRMKKVQVLDQQGFERPMPTVSLLIPVDWQLQGATTWNIKDSCNTIQTHLVATAPDGRGFENFPEYHWVWADDPTFQQQIFAQKARMGSHACDVMAPMSAQDYLRRNLSRIRPNAQLVGFEPAPKLLESLTDQAHQAEQMAQQYKMVRQVKADAIKARVKYTLDGKPVEEWIFAGIMTSGIRGPSLDMRSMQQVQRWTYNCTASTGAQRAPEGQLDASAKLFELIGTTYRWNPEWQAKVTSNALAMQKIEQKGIRDRAAIVAKSAEDTRNTQREIYENQSRSEEHTSAQFSQYIRGVETYRDPDTGATVDLDNRYGHAWINNQGEYLLSDQAGFDPNTVSGNTQSWKQLQVVKK
jgi:hypothetical protein